MGKAVRVAVVAGVAAGTLWFVALGTFEGDIRQSVRVERPMPTFRLPVLNSGLLEGDSTFFDPYELTGKVVLLTFWATWCRPCIAEQPSLLALQEELGDAGLVVLGVLHQDRAGPALEWLEANERLELRTVVGTREFARESHVGGLPNTALIDRGGIVRELFLGYWPERDSYVRDAVRELLVE